MFRLAVLCLHPSLALAAAPPDIRTQTFVVEENSPSDMVIGTIEPSDPGGDNLTYTVIGGDGQGVFDVAPNTGLITVGEGAVLDYEAKSEYKLDIQIEDGETGDLTDYVQVTIALTNVNGLDEIVIDPQYFAVMESSQGGTVVGEIPVTDPDGDNLTYTVLGGDGQGVFDVNQNTGQIIVGQGADLDYEIKSIYQLDVQAQNEDGLTDQAIMTIHVLMDRNGPPHIQPQTFDVEENSPPGIQVNPGPVVASDPDGDNIIYRVIGGSGEGVFNIDPVTGQIFVAEGADLNYDKMPIYTLKVQVESDGDEHLTAQATMAININELKNEPPNIEDLKFQVPENSPEGTPVGVVEATDEDGDVITLEVVGGTGEGVFNLEPDTGDLTVAPGAKLDYETIYEYTLEVVVTDEEGLTDQAVVTIMLINICGPDPTPNTTTTTVTATTTSVPDTSTTSTVVQTTAVISAEESDSDESCFIRTAAGSR